MVLSLGKAVAESEVDPEFVSRKKEEPPKKHKNHAPHRSHRLRARNCEQKAFERPHTNFH